MGVSASSSITHTLLAQSRPLFLFFSITHKVPYIIDIWTESFPSGTHGPIQPCGCPKNAKILHLCRYQPLRSGQLSSQLETAGGAIRM